MCEGTLSRAPGARADLAYVGSAADSGGLAMRELAMSRPRSPATWESYGYTAFFLVQLHTKINKLRNLRSASFDVTTPLFLNRPNTNNHPAALFGLSVVSSFQRCYSRALIPFFDSSAKNGIALSYKCQKRHLRKESFLGSPSWLALGCE